MTAKTLVVVASIALMGCRARVREADAAGAPSSVRSAQAGAARPDAPPLRVDRTQAVRKGPCGVPGVYTLRALERVPIAWDPAEPIVAAWRMTVSSERGTFAIVRIDRPEAPGGFYLGEGIFAGCDQERLAATYSALVPVDDSAPFLLLQLG